MAKSVSKSKAIPPLGFGLGLRIPHYAYIFEHRPPVDFFEIISENFMVTGGFPLQNLEKILESYTVVMHGVCMSLGSADKLDWEYMKKLKALARKTKAPWFSDHLCWTRHNSHHYHDLLPLPYTDAVIKHVAEKARQAQDFLEIPFGMENLSAVADYTSSQMPEWEFYRNVVEKSGCYMMLDANNIYVSSRNHLFNPIDYVNGLDLSRTLQIHLAGHTDKGEYVLDTHDQHVRDEVWEIFKAIYTGIKKFGKDVATMVEWDDNFLSFPETHAEVLKAKCIVEAL